MSKCGVFYFFVSVWVLHWITWKLRFDSDLFVVLFEGTWITASAHIITAVIGSGVLSLAWAIAQLGWVAGPAVLFAFSFITYFTSTLLADCYRTPDPVHGKRNYTYSDVVKSVLGKKIQTLWHPCNRSNRVVVRCVFLKLDLRSH